MTTSIPQSVLEAISKAEDSRDEATSRDRIHSAAVDALDAAQREETRTLSDSLTAHQTALADAQDAITALKTELGIS